MRHWKNDHALFRALRDCGVLRIAFDDERLCLGVTNGYFTASPVLGRIGVFDYRLAPRGVALAQKHGLLAEETA